MSHSVALSTVLLALIVLARLTALGQSKPQLVVQTANDDSISDVVFSPDGKYLLTSDYSGTVILWDIEGHQLKRFHEGKGFDDEPLQGVSISADNRTVAFLLVKTDASGRSTTTLVMRDLGGTFPVKRAVFPGENYSSVALSPTARFVLLGCSLWAPAAARIIHEVNNCNTGAFSPDGETLATLARENNKDVVYSWHLPEMRQIWRSPPLETETDGNERLIFSADSSRMLRTETNGGNYLALNSKDGRLISDKVQWPGGSEEAKIPKDDFNHYAVSPDGLYLAWGGSSGGTQGLYNNTIDLLDYPTGKVIRELGRTPPIAQMVRATGPQANKLLIVDLVGDGYVWDLNEGRESLRLIQPINPDPDDGTTDAAVEEHEATGQSALPDGAISTDGRYVLTAPLGPIGGGPLIWSGETGQLVKTLVGESGASDEAEPDYSDELGSEASDFLEQEGRVLIQGCGSLRLFDIFEQKTIWELPTVSDCGGFGGMRADRDQMRLAGNGTVALVGRFDEKNDSAALVDVKTGRVRARYPGMQGLPVAISPNGRIGAITHFYGPDDDGVDRGKSNTVIFNTGTRAVIKKFPFAARALSFSPDGRRLLLLSTNRLVLADARTGITVASVQLDDVVANDVTFSPDGNFAIVATNEGSARFYRIGRAMPEVCRVFSLHDGNWVVVDPEGRFDTNNIETIKGLVWIAPDHPLRPLPLEIFSRQYFEPGLLRRVLACTRDDTCKNEFKPLPPIAAINRVQPRVGEPRASERIEK